MADLENGLLKSFLTLHNEEFPELEGVTFVAELADVV